jgi:hypothetical protein
MTCVRLRMARRMELSVVEREIAVAYAGDVSVSSFLREGHGDDGGVR